MGKQPWPRTRKKLCPEAAALAQPTASATRAASLPSVLMRRGGEASLKARPHFAPGTEEAMISEMSSTVLMKWDCPTMMLQPSLQARRTVSMVMAPPLRGCEQEVKPQRHRDTEGRKNENKSGMKKDQEFLLLSFPSSLSSLLSLCLCASVVILYKRPVVKSTLAAQEAASRSPLPVTPRSSDGLVPVREEAVPLLLPHLGRELALLPPVELDLLEVLPVADLEAC